MNVLILSLIIIKILNFIHEKRNISGAKEM
jgi:hypothetical protein